MREREGEGEGEGERERERKGEGEREQVSEVLDTSAYVSLKLLVYEVSSY